MSLHVETLGTGEDLVLIHGWGMHGGVWASVRAALAARWRLHWVDLPGMGLSAPVAPCTLESLAHAVAGAVPPKATWCGWSLGGQVAIRLALDVPERVRRLILVGSTPRFVRGADWACGMESHVFSDFADQVTANYREAMDRFLCLQGLGGEASRGAIRTLREQFAARPIPDPAVLRQMLDLLLESDLRAQVADLAPPLLLLHGERDTLVPPPAAQWLAQHVSGARLHVFPGAAHAPFISHPAAFVAELTAFMEQTPGYLPH